MEFTKRQLKFFSKAADVATQSTFGRYKLGCVAVIKNSIIALSSNKLKTHPIQAEWDKYRNFNCRSDPQNIHSLHAEIACLSSIKQDISFKDVELYIVRLLKNGEFGMARPCASCYQYIKHLGIKKIYYSTNYGFAFESIS